MARITEAEVHAAAAALDAQGIKPTASKVREKLGSGSFSTILTYLNSYGGTEKSDNETPEPPESLDEIFLAVWNKTWDTANHMFDGERAKYEAKIKALTEENETLQAIIENQDKEIEKKTEDEKTADEYIKSLEATREKLKEQNAYLKGKLDGKQDKPATKPKKATKPATQTDVEELTGSSH